MRTKLRLVLSITILFLSFYGSAQGTYWQKEILANGEVPASIKRSDVKKLQVYTLATDAFAKELALSKYNNGNNICYFPDAGGKLVPFKITQSQVLSPALSLKYPEIQSYVGNGLGANKDRIRFSISHKGVQSMIVHSNGQRTTFMQKTDGQANRYVVYQRDAAFDIEKDFICNTTASVQKGIASTALKLVDDQMLRKFRIAVSTTGEYTQYHGGTVADALSAINATLTRVNEVFETDLAITLELVANTDQVIFTDETTDPYTGNFNSEVQNTLTSTIGEANYDVGHLFHQDFDNGNAGFIGSVCKDNQKGSAFSSAMMPEGDVFDLDFVAHELGHQFGANHTWSFESEGTLVQAEPASGTTIMGYAGIVDGNNVAPNGDDYFHYYSILQMIQYVGTTSCAVATALTNNPPVITPVEDFIIPKSTAFVLTATATDPDTTDVLTYAWEQIDDGVVTASSFGPDKPSGANFRSQKPSISPERYFPKLAEVAQGNLTQTNPTINSAWETVSDVEREMNFALTVRDNVSGGGQVASDIVNVNVVNSAGPFVVNSQSVPLTYSAGTVQTVVWDVANTDKAPVNAQRVDIFLSLDGGLSFPIQLADATENDGIHQLLLPGNTSTQARIMAKADDNIFFAVNASDFTIEESQVVLNFGQLEYEACQPDDFDIPFIYEAYAGFNEEVTFSTTGAPAELNITFTPPTATATDTLVTMNVTGTDLAAIGNYPITVLATSASLTKDVDIQLGIFNASFPEIVLLSPADATVAVSLKELLQWQEDSTALSYDIEIATDQAFGNILESSTVLSNSYLPTSLEENTTYYWRVKPKNNCGEGTFSTPFSFTTIQISCMSMAATGLPISISPTGTPTITSTITFLNDLSISDVNVSLDIDHTFLSDLIISLVSPSGTTVILTSNSCGEFRNIDAVFDDEAPSFTCGNNPAISGLVRPLGSLASFNGESTFGEWTLTIFDSAPADGGALNLFSLELCVEGSFRPDDDGDGVFDDGDDLCLDTPPDTEVDFTGCPVFRFAPDNFQIAIQSESCIGNNDGTIEITAAETLDYTVTVMGNGVDLSDDFTSLYMLENLSSGTYDLCITGTKGANVFQPFCFEVVVTEPEPLGVLSMLSADGRQAQLILSGATLYNIELNGLLNQVEASEITLQLKDGINTLKVSTNLPCQGEYDEQIVVSNTPIIYPNPFNQKTQLFLNEEAHVQLEIYTANGRLLSKRNYQLINREVEIDFGGLPSGIYFVRIQGQINAGTFKVVKR